MTKLRPICALIAGSLLGHVFAQPAVADEGGRVIRLDHYVGVHSTVPAIAGQVAQIYVREVVRTDTALRNENLANRVVLFVHGAGTPAEVSFDVPYQDYSWMEYLARAGFDTFAMDSRGYGRSYRPAAMNDPRNLSAEQQIALAPGGHGEPCRPSYGQQMTTIASDWTDIGAVVDHLLALRHVSQVSIVGWSLGGPRTGGYAAQNPGKVAKLVLLAPAYGREVAAKPPAQVPAAGAAMNVQSHDDFTALWGRQVGCAGQVDPAVSDAAWSDMLLSDPVGATWGSGVRRAPQVTSWGWNSAMAAGNPHSDPDDHRRARQAGAFRARA
jgi:pimeloyl-ACP methyl ester carboxylesterase